MASTTTAPIKRALVQKLRAILGGSSTPELRNRLHQGAAPKKATYPFVTYAFLPSTRTYQWAPGYQINVLVDIFVFAENPVDAENIDSLIADGLNDADLSVDGQTLWLCRRVADVSQPPRIDGSNRRVYQIGGTFRLITDQT